MNQEVNKSTNNKIIMRHTPGNSHPPINVYTNVLLVCDFKP